MKTSTVIMCFVALILATVIGANQAHAQDECPCPYFVDNNTDMEITLTVFVGDRHRTVTVGPNREGRVCFIADVCPQITKITVGDSTCFAGHSCTIDGKCYTVAGNGVTINPGACP